MKPAFQIYHEDMETIEDLSNEELGMLIRLLNAYAKGEEVDVPDCLKYPFKFMAKKIDKDANAYQEKVNKTKRAAEARWKNDADASENMQMDADASERMQMDATEPNRTKPNRTKTDKESNSSRTPSAKASDFDRLWDLYPRKEGKQAAFEAYKRAIHDGTPIQVIEDGIMRYKEHLRIKRTEPRFIKQGATFFRQRAWMDVFDDSPPREVVDRGMDFMQRDDDMSDVLMEL